ncbi:MAG: short-chain dehydrogenase/reductase, partial [Holophagaceae bacterium]|nr:short-chain dehydrogenase/reductase [Holophagaceae bacterium]
MMGPDMNEGDRPLAKLALRPPRAPHAVSGLSPSNAPVLILGATSPMARGLATALAESGHSLYLASRDVEECARLASDLRVRFGATVFHGHFDAEDLESHLPFLGTVVETLGSLEGVVSLVGTMGTDPATLDSQAAERIIRGNYLGVVSILGACAKHFESQRRGAILGVTSVAGDRGRQSNFVYGSAKGALSLWLSGLRNLMHPKGVRVVTFKPGFVDTAMT